ncbi:DUF4158 domain-containing protein [Nonomuraea sp. AD125B]|uniref:DUF4158 domain-containing protein n=1 Tax=Nonomuraea sp. AD125B TaxID=3242897 RepID=UPI003528CE82
MLGTFLAEDSLNVPVEVLEFVAEQLGIDPACAPEYLTRPKTAYEHAWEIRDLLELAEFSKREQEVRDYLAARVWSTIEGPRALFDRAVVHMLREGILLPTGITTLTRLISEVRRGEHARLYRTLAERAGSELRARLTALLQVPADRRVSELERLRTAPTRASGRVMVAELHRVAEIGRLGAGAVVTEPVPAVKLSVPARSGAGTGQACPFQDVKGESYLPGGCGTPGLSAWHMRASLEQALLPIVSKAGPPEPSHRPSGPHHFPQRGSGTPVFAHVVDCLIPELVPTVPDDG